MPLQQDHHHWRNSRTPPQQCVQMLWATWQSDIRPRTSVCFQSIQRKQLGINFTMSTAYHPQTNGAIEQSNQEIEAYLCIFCGNNPEQWSTLLLMLELSYNQKPHAKMLKSPFYLMYGENPMAIPIAYQKINIPWINDWLSSFHQARDKAQAAHELARQQMLQKITNKFKPFQKGDKVWLESKNLKLQYKSWKLAPKQEGPFKIQEVLGPLTYWLELPKTMEDPPHIPHHSPLTLQRKWHLWKQLYSSIPWPYQWTCRVWSGGHTVP